MKAKTPKYFRNGAYPMKQEQNTVATLFWTFHQNNSGGSFHHDPISGIGYKVCVEAVDASHAIARALDIGLYFNGCAAGRDCKRCGDRWYDYMSDSDGTAEPEGYGSPLTGGWGIPSYVHYLDGRIELRAPVSA
jgi:hypothetical protein